MRAFFWKMDFLQLYYGNQGDGEVMKRRLLPILIILTMLLNSTLAVADEDYSYLDRLSVEQLQELDAEIHKRLSSENHQVSVSAGSEKDQTDSTVEQNTEIESSVDSLNNTEEGSNDKEKAEYVEEDIIGVWGNKGYEGKWMTFLRDGTGFFHDEKGDFDDYMIEWKLAGNRLLIIYPENTPAYFDFFTDGSDLCVISEDKSVSFYKDNTEEIEKEMLYVPKLEGPLSTVCGTDEFSLKYDHCMLGRMKDGTVVAIVIFDFSSMYTEPASFINTINARFYQNSVEVSLPSVAYSDWTLGEEAYGYMSNATKNVLSGGSLKAALMIPVGDGSPITVNVDEHRYYGDGEWTSSGTLVFYDLNEEQDYESLEENEELDSVPQDPISISELEKALREQPVYVESTHYLEGDPKANALYPDILCAVFKNVSGADIKDVVVSFVAWDSNNYPIIIYTLGGEDDYVSDLEYKGINLINGNSYGQDEGLALSSNALHEHRIANFKAVVKSYTDLDGNTWTNPLYYDWVRTFKDKILVEDNSSPEGGTEGGEIEISDAEQIKKFQQYLNDKGFNCGTPDGVVGAKTVEAIKQFQKSNSLEPTGIITEDLLSMIND